MSVSGPTIPVWKTSVYLPTLMPEEVARKPKLEERLESRAGIAAQNGQFGFRTWDFFRISTFGFRISQVALSRGLHPRTSAFAERRAELITP